MQQQSGKIKHIQQYFRDFYLQDNYTDNMTIQDAVNLALRTLKQVMEEKLSSTNVEVMIMKPGSLFQMYTKAEVEKIIEDLQ